MANPWERDWSAPAESTPSDGAGPWARDWEAPAPAKERTFGDKAADLGRTVGAAAVSAAGAVPTFVGRAIEEGGQKLGGLTMDEARRLAEADGTPDRALEYYEKANRFNPVARVGQAIESGGRAVMGYADQLRDGRSEEAKQAIQDSTPKGDIFSPSTWQAPKNPSVEGMLGVAAEGVGSVATSVGTALATRGRSAETQMRAGGMSVAGQIGGAAMDEAGEYLGSFDDAALAQASPVFRNLVEKGYKPEAARTLLLRDAENRAGAFAAPVGMAGGAATAALLGKWGEKVAAGAVRPVRAAVLAAMGATEEGLQEVAEGMATRAAINDAAGTTRSVTDGTLEEFTMGAMGGGPVAGARGLAGGGREAGQPAATPAETPPTPAEPAQTPPNPIEQGSPTPSNAVATTNTDEAERALLEPKQLTSLDRVSTLDGEIQRLEARAAELTPEQGYGQAFDAERAEVAAEADQLRAERQAITSSWPTTIKGAPAQFSTEAGVRLDGEYALIDADDLQTSHDTNLRANPLYPTELQPRDRSRQASELQVSSIVQRLDPNRLGLSADSANGAPIIGADGLVESGNARTIALKRVYQANGQKAADYRAFLRDNAAQFGLNPDQVEGMQKPVLVRVRKTPVNRAEFARQANASTIARMSTSEQALADSRRLTSLEGLEPDDTGDFSSSRDFIRQFMATLPITEQSDMIEADGQLSTAGYRRIQNAVLAKAYGDSPTLRRMTESMDDNLRNVTKALTRVAPTIAESRARIDAGVLHDADLATDLLSAVEGLSALKEKGWTVEQELAQEDLTGAKYSPEAIDLLRMLDENARAPRRIAEFLQRYYEALEQAGDPSQGSLLGDEPAPTTTQLLDRAKGKTDGTPEHPSQPSEPPAAPAAAREDRPEPADAGGRAQGAQGNETAPQVAENDQADWVAFPPDSGTLGIPRANMPQIKQEHRGALVNFLNARGIEHEAAEVDPETLKPSQAEYSKKKTARFAAGGDRTRSVLVSDDGYVLDGHHQWMAARAANEPVNIIRFHAGIGPLLEQVAEFPSVGKGTGSPDLDATRAAAVDEFKAAMGDLVSIMSKHTRAAIVPEDTPGLMPVLVRLFDAAIKIVGTDLKAATRYVKDQLKGDDATKKLWNKISDQTYAKAALQALEGQGSSDLLADQPKVATIDGRPYDPKRDNFKPPAVAEVLPADLVAKADSYVDRFYKGAEPYNMPAEARAQAELLLAPRLALAREAKVEFDQKVIDIATRSKAIGQMLANVKGIQRASEKMHQDATAAGRDMDPADIKDLLRSTICVQRYDDADDVLADIRKEFDVLRVKDRRSAQARKPFGGYGDVLVNVRMPNGTTAEIQINVPAMLAVKANQGHKLYEVDRALPPTDKKKADVVSAMEELYEAAYEAAEARDRSAQAMNPASDIGAPARGPSTMPGKASSEAPSSEALNQRPSGNRTNSSPEKSATNKQPGGKESGNFIDKPLTSNVADLAVNGYTQRSLLENDDANEQPGQGRNARKGAGAVSPAAGARDAERDGRRNGRADQRPGGDDDASRPRARGVGQAGADGVREADADGQLAQPRDGARSVAAVPAGRDIAPKSGRNYEFGAGDLTYEGSWFKKAEQNVAAVELLKQLERDGRQATREEQATLAKFTGWGSSEMANALFGARLDQQLAAAEQFEQAMSLAKANGGRLFLRDRGYYQAFEVLRSKGEAKLDYYTHGPITTEQLQAAKPASDLKRWVPLRDKLRELLSKEELAEAARSTQYAHYTSKAVVSSMWAAMERMGFKGGMVLEPGAGIGVFPGLMPTGVAASSSYTGIEFDSTTGGILKQLFPDEHIRVESFVDSKLPKNFYDVAIGNPPFSNTKVLADPEYAKQALALHDYFFAKTIDRVKPGGLVMFVTSRFTMDKLNDAARKYMADRADLVGAIRLPQTAFKQNAGTEVVTDVLFLRKKVKGETFEHAQPWMGVAPALDANGDAVMTKDGKGNPEKALINEYFAAHPEMVLGENSAAGSMYREAEYTVTPRAGNIEDHFADAIKMLPADIYQGARGSAAEAAQVREIDFNPKAQKEGNYYVSDAGQLMVREGGVGQRVDMRSAADTAMVKDFVPLRDALKQAHYDQLTDGDWETSLAALKKAYDAFTKKHGQINQFVTKVVKSKRVDEETGEAYTDETTVRSFPLLKKLEDDPDYTLVAALEELNDDTGEIKPSAFLSQRVLGKSVDASINSPTDALLTTLNDVGRVDIPTIAARLGMTEAQAIEALGSTVYEDPEDGWQTADQYLSGNVKRKLGIARDLAKKDRAFERNVTALEAAQPSPKGPSQISPSIGMNWIPGEDYARFLKETTGVSADISFNTATRQWNVRELSGGRLLTATADWGTPERNATDILSHALTGRPIRVTKTQGAGKDKVTVFDANATEAANQKLDKMRDAFTSWIWQDAERTERLVRVYNDTFNTTVPRKFDGSHLTLPGTSKAFQVFDHVKRGAWRIIQSGNTYLAHAVGSGKTFQMVIAAMEQKRLGLIKKPMVVVPNHMLKQFAHEWQMLYPAARLMVADENQFHTENRRRFVSRVALSDLDGVIITHSAFKLLDLDPEFKAEMVEEQLVFMRAALEEAEGEDKRSTRVKQIEKQIENLEQKLTAATSGAGKDRNVRFDELGVDQIMVDEAHEYRKLDFATSRQVKGISPEGSAKALDLYMKSRYLERKNPGRSLVMASGTVITNTIAELYTVQKFMDRQALIDKGIEDFDSWAAMFGRERTTLEPDAAGRYAPVTRFTKFVNVPELTQMFREYADVLTADNLAVMLGDKRPKVRGGSRVITITPKTKEYAAYQKELERRVQASRDWRPTKDQPNNPDPIIKIIGDGRLAAIDMRFVLPGAENDPQSKLNQLIDKVIADLKASADLEYRDKAGKVEPNKGATMMVFSDLGFGAGVAKTRGFDARAWFEKRLREAGIPSDQVAFMSDFKKSADKLKLFKDVNAGRVRLLTGSSKNMGTGVNAQQRLLHEKHLDSPWYPADLEQREGRIIRQGNKNQLVDIEAFATMGTYDQNMWKMLASKQYFIDQAMSGDENLREIEDLDSMSQFDLAAAMMAEDPRVLQLAGAKADAEKMQRLYQAHEDQRIRFRSEYRHAQATLDFNQKHLPAAEKNAERVEDLSGEKFHATAGGQEFTERAKWAEALVAKFNDLAGQKATDRQKLGEISSFEVFYKGVTVGEQFEASMFVDTPPEPTFIHSSVQGEPNMAGLALRAQNATAAVAKLPAVMRDRIARAAASVDGLAARLEAPFPMAQMLADKVREVNDLEAAIAADSADKTYRVERTSTGAGFDVRAPNPQAAIEKAIENSGGTAEEWIAVLDKESLPAPDTRLSRAAKPDAAGVELPELQRLARRIQSRMPNMPKVNVLASPADAPAELRGYIEDQGAMGDAEGAMHDGELYLFASGLSDLTRAEFVLAEHEAGHIGLHALLGPQVAATMHAIHHGNASVRRAALELRKRGKLSLAEAVEEVIVDIPTADLVKLTGWRKLATNVRDFLERSGFTRLAAMLTELLEGTMPDQLRADLMVADLVRAAREFVAGRRGGLAKAYRGITRLSGTLKADLEKQEAWLLGEARARGYKDIEDLLERNYPLFEKLAMLWRQKNPADTLLSRAPAQASSSPAKTVTERADDIINKSAARTAPLDTAAKALTHLTGFDRLTGGIYKRAAMLLDRVVPEKVKAGIVSDYGIPEAVLDQRTMLQGRQRVQLRKAGTLIEKLATLTREESRIAYEWMNMDGADPKAYVSMMQGLPEESVKVLQEVQQLIDKLSQEAVRMGQLSADAFKRNRFAYLRRSYAKHVLEQTTADKAKRARTIAVLGEQYKGRGLVKKEPMARMRQAAPEWWGRKLKPGQADTALKGEKFIRLERYPHTGTGTQPLAGMTSPTNAGRKPIGVAYWPAGEKIPAQYDAWVRADTWEVRTVQGGDVVLWRDFTKDEREKMGEIDEARFAIAKTLHAMIHDVEVGRYLEWLARTQAIAPGKPIPGVVVDASERLRDTFAKNEYVLVPDSKIPGTDVLKYGALAGRYLPGPVWNDLRQVVGQGPQLFGETYQKLLTMWKTSKTALSPAVHMNNVMSNFVMADWQDVRATHVAKALRIVLAASGGGGKGALGNAGNVLASAGGIADKEAATEVLNRYKDAGGDVGSWVTNEIARDQLDPLLADLEKELIATGGQSVAAQTGVFAALQQASQLRFPEAWEAFKAGKVAKGVATEAGSLIDLYQREDDVFRLAAWLKAKEDGHDDLTAGKMAKRSFLDYNINAPWIQAMRKSAWPFISFTYRAVPLLADVAAHKPHKLLKLMGLAAGLNALGMLLAGGDDDDEERARKMLPEEKAGRIWGMVPKLIRMPWNDAHGSPVYLDIRRWVPVGDVFDIGQGQSAIPMLPGLMPGGPLVIAGEVVLNKSAFTGKPVTLETDTTWQAAGKVTDHLYKAFAPNIIGLPGSYATTGVLGSLQGRTDAFGREFSTAQALSSAFGVKLGSYPVDVLRRNLTVEATVQLAEIDKNISGFKRQYATRRIDKAEFDELVGTEIEKKKKIATKLREKLN